MKTSYYANLKNIDKAKFTPIAISGDCGKLVGFEGVALRELSPYPFFKKWKTIEDKIDDMYDAGEISLNEYRDYKNLNQNSYIKQFYQKVLKKLDPQEVYSKIQNNAVLLCFEKPTSFCHRFLVAGWLEYSLNIEVNELGYENDKQVQDNCAKLKSKIINEIEKDRMSNNIKGVENGKEK